MNRLVCVLFNNPSMIQLGNNKKVVKELLDDLMIPRNGKSNKINRIFLHNGKIIDGNKNMHPDNYKLIEKIYQALRLKFIMIYFNSDDLNISYKENKGYVSNIMTCFDSDNDLEKNGKLLFKKYKLYFMIFILFFIILVYKYK